MTVEGIALLSVREPPPTARSPWRNLGASFAALLLHGLTILLFASMAAPVRPGGAGAQDGRGSGDGAAAVPVLLTRRSVGRPAAAPTVAPPPADRRQGAAAADLTLAPVASLAEATPEVPIDPSPAASVAAAAQTEGGAKGCDIAGAIQAQLQLDPGARTAASGWPETRGLLASPRLLWSGRWADAEALGGGDTLAPIRHLVAAVIASAPPDCVNEEVQGVLGFSVQTAGGPLGATGLRAVAFALGTEHWRWRDLLEDGPGSTATP